MADLGTKIGAAFIEVGANIIGFGEGLASELVNSTRNALYPLADALESFGKATFTKFSLPLIAATTANIAQFQALDREVRTVLTLFGTADSIVDDTFQAMSAGIRQVSEDVGGLEKDIAEGLYQAISAGVPRGDVFGFLDVAQMAAIADRSADLTTAVDGLTTVLNAFQLEAGQTSQVADVMFKTVALGKTTFGELSSDIGRVAPLAANAGVEFEELFAIIGALTLQGLKTSEAISFMRAAITGLLRPTDELQAVFEKAGYASAELAIPAIGLQNSFQLVYDAVGGSTSQLQELIGTSEGVSAVLGITGTNAATFSRIMDGVANSTGATAQAFSIVDEGIGRKFGRLTEAFDRMGNTFGEFAAQFAGPALELGVDIVNRMIAIFEKARPFVEGLSIAWEKFIRVLQVPVIEQVVSVLAAVATTAYGAIGALGLFALTIGKVIRAGLAVISVTKLWSSLAWVLGGLKLQMQSVGITMTTVETGLGKLKTSIPGATTVVGKLGAAMKTSIGASVAAGLAFAGVTAALGALAAGISWVNQKQKEAIESQDIYGKGIDTLLDSMGLLNEAVKLPGVAEGRSALLEFQEANAANLTLIEKVNEELGQLAGLDIAESLVVQVVLRGNTAEDALEVQENLKALTKLPLDLDLTGLQDADFVLETFQKGVFTAIDATDGLRPRARQAASAIAQVFEAARQSGNAQPFIDTLNKISEQIADTPGEARALRAALADVFMERYDVSLTPGWSLQAPLDPDRLLEIMAKNGFQILDESVVIPTVFEPPTFEAADLFKWRSSRPGRFTADPFADIFSEDQKAEVERRAQAMGLSVRTIMRATIERGSDAVGGAVQAFEQMDQAWGQAKQSILAAMGEIRDGVMAQMPVLDIYTGAVEQSFTEWKKGQLQFQEDVAAVTELRARIQRETPELIEVFDRQPLSKQAWLESLSPDNLNEALGLLAESFRVGDENAQERITQSFESILNPVFDVLEGQYTELAIQAGLAGGDVAAKFDRTFQDRASEWPTSAAYWIGKLEEALGAPLSPPSIGDFGVTRIPATGTPLGGVSGTTYQVIFYGVTSNDPERDAERAMGVIRTQEIYNGNVSQ